MGIFYHTAYLPPLPDWQESPYESNETRFLGLVQTHNRSYRTTSGHAAAKLVTMNHPRILRPDIAQLLSDLVPDIIWSQRFDVRQHLTYSTDTPTDPTTAHLWELRANTSAATDAAASNAADTSTPAGTIGDILHRLPALTTPPPPPPPGAVADILRNALTESIFLHTLAWNTTHGPLLKNRAYNDHLYLGITTQDHYADIVTRLPPLITYM